MSNAAMNSVEAGVMAMKSGHSGAPDFHLRAVQVINRADDPTM